MADIAPTVDPTELMQLFRTMQGQTTASMADLDAALAAAKGAAGASAGAAQTEAEGQIAVNNAQFAAKVKEQRDNAAAAALVGMTPGAPSDLIVSTMQQYQSTEAELNSRAAMIKDKQATGFLDNPFQWFTNQFTLPNDIAAYNTEVGTQQRRLDFLAGLSNAFQEQAKVNSAVDVATDESLLAGMNKIAVAKAKAAAAASAASMARLGIDAINMRINMSNNVFAGYMRMSEFAGRQQAQQQDLSFREQANARAEQENARAQAEADARSQDRQRQEKGRAAIQENLTRITTLLNLPAVSVEQYQLDPNVRKLFEPYMFSLDIQTGRFGPTTADAVTNVQNLPLTPGNDITRQWLTSKQQSLITATPTWRQLGPEAQAALTSKRFGEDISRERNNIPVQGGLYSAPPMKAVLTMAALQAEDGKSYRFQILNDLAPLAQANPDAAFDPNILLASAVKHIKAGDMSPDQASQEISSIYKAIGLDNSTLRGYNRFRLPSLLAGNGGFKQEVNLTSLFGQSSVIDLMDPIAVRNALARLRSRLGPMGTVPNN